VPELPEVEYVARQLRQELIGHRFVAVRVLWPRAVIDIEPPDFEARLLGREVVEIGRRAKFLLLGLDDGQTLVIHRRMSGNLLFLPLDWPERHARVEFRLEDGRRLVFSDPRTRIRASLDGYLSRTKKNYQHSSRV
jgi:formamidopyrimidine-DNA glycosylase